MGIIAIEDVPPLLASGGTLAGIDLGDKTIGVAVSDRGQSFAHPRPVIMRKKFSIDAAALLALLGKENVAAIVIGLPINMDGSEGPRAQKSRAFVRNMAPLSPLPFVLWDERLSTVAAERSSTRSSGMPRPAVSASTASRRAASASSRAPGSSSSTTRDQPWTAPCSPTRTS